MKKSLLRMLIQFYLRFTSILFVPGVLFLLFVFIMIRIELGLLPVPNAHLPTITYDVNSRIPSNITQILDDGQRLYVLYNNRGIIQTFDLEGNYQYAIMLCASQNGSYEMATQDGKLYVKDIDGNMGVFQGDVLEEFIENNESTRQRIRSISDRVGMYKVGTGTFKRKQSEDYKIRFSSIWRTAVGEKAHCVVKRPLWLAVFQIDLMKFVFGFLVFIVLPTLLHGRKN